MADSPEYCVGLVCCYALYASLVSVFLMNKQCPSCGGDCGGTKATGCRYAGISPAAIAGVVDLAKNAMKRIAELEAGLAQFKKNATSKSKKQTRSRS